MAPCNELDRKVSQDHQQKGQGIIPFKLTVMHEFCYSSLQEVVNVLDSAIASEVVEIAVYLLYA